jgi:hypothetical protein
MLKERSDLRNFPGGGRYTIYSSDLDAGDSEYTMRPSDSGPAQKVTLTSVHPKAEFNFRLPPPAGFLHIHLTNRITGETIPERLRGDDSPS